MSTELDLTAWNNVSTFEGYRKDELLDACADMQRLLRAAEAEIGKYKAWAASCDPSPAIQAQLGASRTLLEEWMLASDDFDMDAWAIRVRDMLEDSNPFNAVSNEEWLNQRLANARIRNSELEQENARLMHDIGVGNREIERLREGLKAVIETMAIGSVAYQRAVRALDVTATTTEK